MFGIMEICRAFYDYCNATKWKFSSKAAIKQIASLIAFF